MAERQYLQEEIHNNKKSNSLMWKAIRNYIPRKEITQPVYTGDLKLLVNEFNEFFTTAGARATETVKSLANENGISFNATYEFGHLFRRRVLVSCGFHICDT
jgi:predicted RNA-binding protein with PUA-like domain